ncbi:MAG: SUMF1/EgtB/PvdO family nonheme iron enzyme [bacterium]|nr:SUMF1/EgtB/PvdO family nonheme iron enzyme [bacterium]
MPRLFLSFRRADSKSFADTIYDALAEAFGRDNILSDVEDIPFGVDFRDYLWDEIAKQDIVLVIIGRGWALVRDDFGRKVIENPADMVRMVIEIALQQKKMLIPILIGGASMPIATDIPESLQELCYRRPFEILGNTAFKADMEKLISGIKRLNFPSDVPQKPMPKPSAPPPPITVVVQQAPTPPAPEPIMTPPPVVEMPPPPEVILEPPPVVPPPITTGILKPQKPRVGASLILPPPFEWVEVRAGILTIKEAIRTQTVYLDTFYMAKYPITNTQYQVFLDDSDGYVDPAWWEFSDMAIAWRNANPAPKPSAFLGDEFPRTNVSWYDAVAFCRWLSARMAELPATQSEPFRLVTLPSEYHWQRAAQGDDGRVYSWGNKFETKYAHFNVNKPASVLLYPESASPYGVVQMCGNVYEWCLMEDEITDGGLDINPTHKRRSLRGGAWSSLNSAELQIKARLLLAPDYVSGSAGFRIMRV